MISVFVLSQLREARLIANFRFISTTPTELGAAVLTFVRHDIYISTGPPRPGQPPAPGDLGLREV